MRVAKRAERAAARVMSARELRGDAEEAIRILVERGLFMADREAILANPLLHVGEHVPERQGPRTDE